MVSGNHKSYLGKCSPYFNINTDKYKYRQINNKTNYLQIMKKIIFIIRFVRLKKTKKYI